MYGDVKDIATDGYLCDDVKSIPLNGYICITIEDLNPTFVTRKGASPYEPPKKVSRREVKIVVIIDGKEYVKTLIVKNRPDLKVEDIKVSVLKTNTHPKIKITFSK